MSGCLSLKHVVIRTIVDAMTFYRRSRIASLIIIPSSTATDGPKQLHLAVFCLSSIVTAQGRMINSSRPEITGR